VVEGEEVEVNEVEEEMKVEDTGGEEVEVEGEEVVEVGTTEEKGAEVGRAAGKVTGADETRRVGAEEVVVEATGASVTGTFSGAEVVVT